MSKICPPIEKLYVLFLIVSGCKNSTTYGEARALKWFPLKKAIDYQMVVVDGQLRVGITVGNVRVWMSVKDSVFLFCFFMPCLVSLLLINF